MIVICRIVILKSQNILLKFSKERSVIILYHLKSYKVLVKKSAKIFQKIVHFLIFHPFKTFNNIFEILEKIFCKALSLNI